MAFRIVGFLARRHGLNGLEALIQSKDYELACVFTHKLNPRSEDEKRAVRPEFSSFQELTTRHNIPLHCVDNKAQAELVDELLSQTDFDAFASISWRRLIPIKQLQMAPFGGVNLHRGKLPNYPGAKPIEQAYHAQESKIEISAHVLEEKYDSGELLATYTHVANWNPNDPLPQEIERLKVEITPHFGPLLLKALDQQIKQMQELFASPSQ